MQAHLLHVTGITRFFLMHEMPNLLQRGRGISTGCSEKTGLFNNLVVRLFDMLFMQKGCGGNLQKWQVL